MTDSHRAGSVESDTARAHFYWRTMLICLIKGIILAIIGSFAVAFFARLNARILSSLPWFLATAAIVCLLVVRSSVFRKSTVPVVLNGARAWWLSLGLAAALGIAAVVLSGLLQPLAAEIRLPGDRMPGTALFRALASLAIFASAAFVEEAAVRGQVQSRLQELLPPAAAEVIADVLFVLLHFLRFATPGEVLFVSILSIVCGRVAALTQSIRWPIVVHLGANLIIMGAVLLHRI
jgi:membrane protease YdiL (CAAX protease family)